VVTDLGTLGGTSAQAVDINESGHVVGAATTAASQYRAFVWHNGTMTDLGTLGGNSSGAAAINNAGQIVGAANAATGAPGRAVLWQNGMRQATLSSPSATRMRSCGKTES
jgi:probable HAF family extracellular repeat protein